MKLQRCASLLMLCIGVGACGGSSGSNTPTTPTPPNGLSAPPSTSGDIAITVTNTGGLTSAQLIT
jgi:hypothetical protein